MKSQSHHIKKQIFQLKVSGKQDAYKIQQSISDYFWKLVSPRMQTLFDHLVKDDTVIKVDRLVVDLGEITLRELISPDGISKLIRAMELSLTEKIVLPTRGTTKTSKRYSQWEQWLYYLSHGNLPWMAGQKDLYPLKNILEYLVLESHAVESLLRTVKSYPDIIQRLAWQHTEQFQVSLLEVLTGHTQHDIIKLRIKAEEFIKQLVIAHKAKKGPDNHIGLNISFSKINTMSTDYFWPFVWREVIINGNLLKPSKFVQRWLKQQLDVDSDGNTKALLQMHTHLLEKDEVKKLIAPIIDEKLSENEIENQGNVNRQKTDKNSAYDIGKNEANQNRYDQNVGQNENKDSSLINQSEDEKLWDNNPDDMISDSQDEWYLQNAGVILMHAFLPRFFNALNLCKEGKFIDNIKKQKAVHLLHYIATGEIQPPEYEVTLYKFLCGIPFNLPIRKIVRLSAKEKRECNKLISAAIDHWEILGNTSAEGLRESFFQREGKLQHTDQGWQLLIEQNSIDVLLDKLPWNLGIVKFPWMEEILKVNWR